MLAVALDEAFDQFPDGLSVLTAVRDDDGTIVDFLATDANAASSSTEANRPGAYDRPVVNPRAPSSMPCSTSACIVLSSSSVGGRFALPSTNRRSELWPTNVVTFVAGRAAVTASR